MKIQLPILLLCLFFSSIIYGQLPVTKLYQFNVKQISDQKFEFYNGKLLSQFNPVGYNNQPQYFSNNELYLTVQEPSDTTQTEIYSLQPGKRLLTRVTDSYDSEYSPTLMPDGENFSCVRVETKKNNVQKLWQFPVDRSNDGRRVFEEITDIGYHYWLSNTKVALFIVGNPHSLVIADTRTEKQEVITSNIGRGLGKLPNGNLVYVSKSVQDRWELKEYDPLSGRKKHLVPTVKGSEDFAILPEGTILMGRGSIIYKFNKSVDTSWVEIADLGIYGVSDISRLALSQDGKIAIVSR